jgi:hypothetical protein
MSERTLRMEEVKGGWLILTNTRVVSSNQNQLGKGSDWFGPERWSVPLDLIGAASARRPKGSSATEEIEIQYRVKGSIKVRKFVKVPNLVFHARRRLAA